jgi:hypothetical protein
MLRKSDSTGILSFSSKLGDEVLAPGSLPKQVQVSGDNTPTEAIKHALVLGSWDVGNKTGNTCRAGLGYIMPDLKIYEWDGSDVASMVDITDALPKNVDSQALAFVANDKINGLVVTLSASNVTNTSVEYDNGSAMVSLVEMDHLDMSDITPPSIGVWKTPFDMANNMVSVLLESDVDLVSAKAVHLFDFVDTVASGNSLSNEEIGDYVVPRGAAVTPYISEASANNWVKIEYSQQ